MVGSAVHPSRSKFSSTAIANGDRRLEQSAGSVVVENNAKALVSMHVHEYIAIAIGPVEDIHHVRQRLNILTHPFRCDPDGLRSFLIHRFEGHRRADSQPHTHQERSILLYHPLSTRKNARKAIRRELESL